MLTHIPEQDRAGLRKFGLMMAGMIALLFGLLLPWVTGRAWPLAPWLIAAIFVAWALLLPMALNPVYRIWMRFGMLMGGITSRILLSLVYFGMLTPIGCWMRVRGKDPLKRTFDPERTSYREPKAPIEPQQMERPF